MRALIWLDSLALAIAVSAGAGVALGLEQSPVVVILMGMITGCMGGLMRDVVVGEVPLVLRKGELYVTAAFTGAASAVLAVTLGLSVPLALLLCAAVTWTLRAGSLWFGWHLPVYRSTPPKG